MRGSDEKQRELAAVQDSFLKICRLNMLLLIFLVYGKDYTYHLHEGSSMKSICISPVQRSREQVNPEATAGAIWPSPPDTWRCSRAMQELESGFKQDLKWKNIERPEAKAASLTINLNTLYSGTAQAKAAAVHFQRRKWNLAWQDWGGIIAAIGW